MSQQVFIGGTALIDPIRLLERVGVRGGMHVADFGCGVTGHFVIPAARMVGTTGKVYAVDIQKSVLRAVESRASLEGIVNIVSVWSDIERIGAASIPPKSLDVVLLVNNLSIARAHADVLREAVRLLKSDGVLVVVDWKPEASALGPHAEQRVSTNVVRATAAAVGFTERDAFDAGPYHYGLVFTRA